MGVKTCAAVGSGAGGDVLNGGWESTSDNEDDGSSVGDSSCESDGNEDLPPQPLAFVVMACVISGYTLIGPLQHDLKHALRVADVGHVGELFTQGVALVQWGKTLTTVLQNFLFWFLSPVGRVYLAIVVMFVGVLIPPLMIFTLGSTWLGWVPLAYGLIGLALGVFECTYLSVISPLGPRTKSWAIMGFPAAFFLVNVVWLAVRVKFHTPVVVSFWYIVLCLPVAFLAFRKIAPKDTNIDGKSYKQADFVESLTDSWAWLPKMAPFCMVNTASHFVMESALPAVFNTYNANKVSMLGPEDPSWLVDKTLFMIVFCISFAAGDMISRKIGYWITLKTTMANYIALLFALCCVIVGLVLTVQGIALLACLSSFVAFFGNGFNYAVTAKYIDRFVPRKHNLSAYTVWMFVGYCGAIAGAVLVSVVRGLTCGGKVYEFQCLTHSHK